MVTGSQMASRKSPGHFPTQTPAVALILPILISAAAGKTSMSAFFTYGKTIWPNRHLMCGSALKASAKAPAESRARALRGLRWGPSADTLTPCCPVANSTGQAAAHAH